MWFLCQLLPYSICNEIPNPFLQLPHVKVAAVITIFMISAKIPLSLSIHTLAITTLTSLCTGRGPGVSGNYRYQTGRQCLSGQ